MRIEPYLAGGASCPQDADAAPPRPSQRVEDNALHHCPGFDAALAQSASITRRATRARSVIL